MSGYQIIGALMVLALFGGGFFAIVREDGWRAAVVTFGIAIGAAAWLIAASILLTWAAK